ncbi:MAG: hypothetical protein CVU07_09595 [Bacteroidetes bacterium HGW-Bacteroidetes-23]|nr:MAG: hypothetical protein CVU07_09595 [Bacteroidetes bacterium HGW-Bacteroidetes-23]
MLPETISSFVHYEDYTFIFIALGSLFIGAFICFLLIYKADFIINKLELDKGFDDENIILGNLDSSRILKLAILLVGFFLVIDYVPNFLYHIINAFKKEVSLYGIEGQKVDYFNLSVSLINIILGYLLITNYKRLADYLDR